MTPLSVTGNANIYDLSICDEYFSIKFNKYVCGSYHPKICSAKEKKKYHFYLFFSFLALPQFNGESCLKITPPLQCYFVVFHFFLNRPKFTFIVHRVYQKPYIQLYTQMMIFSRKFRNLFVLFSVHRCSAKSHFIYLFFKATASTTTNFHFDVFIEFPN